MLARIAGMVCLLLLAVNPALAQCSFTVGPQTPFVDSTAQTVTVQIAANAANCAWTSSASGFATINSGPAGTGNGATVFAVQANATGTSRTANLTVAGQTVVLTQRSTVQTFADIFPQDFYFEAASLFRGHLITAGCSVTPLNYCPNDNVTRGQMAIFVVRSVSGGGASADNFIYSTTPYFTDVPASHPYFKWIQRMRDLGVTAGCSATQYCPDAFVTRGQMAVFIVRTRVGASTNFTFNPSPLFTDVAANYPYFRWIQKLREVGVTAGCSPTQYCPEDLVTRGQMAIFLVRAGFNELLSATAPIITSASPNGGSPGATFTTAITGLNTHFVQGTTTLQIPDGATVNSVTVTDATHLTASVTIAANAAQGPRSVTAMTGAEEATLPNGFIVGNADPLPTITDFNPKSGPAGTLVTLTGTRLVSSFGTPVDVRLTAAGGGVISAPLGAASVSSLTFIIPTGAATGTVQVAGSSGTATSSATLTITPATSFTVSALPATSNVIRGQTTTFTVTLVSVNGFAQLAQLGVSGVPAGVTATFSPAQITVGQQSVLTLAAPVNQALGTSTLTVTGTAVVDGIAVSANTGVSLVVQPITTSFSGRTVVSDGGQTSLAHVKVTMLGVNGSGGNTGCTGTGFSDNSGNFTLTGLPAACAGPQLVGFDGTTVTSPAGVYAGVNLVYTLTLNQVTTSPVLVHLPRIDNKETFLVKQNWPTDQTYVYTSIPGLSVIVYKNTTFTLQDGTVPNPFPLAAIQVPVDRLPDYKPPVPTMLAVFIVAFQPANANASKPVAIFYPNTLNTPPGTSMSLLTLDPTKGAMVPYGTGVVSNDGVSIIPDFDAAHPGARYGIVHFDWHGQMPPPPPGTSPPPDPCSPSAGKPVDLATGVEVMTSTDIVLRGTRGSLSIVRTYRTLSQIAGPFGLGTSHEFDYRLDTNQPQNAALINLILPTATRVPFNRQTNGTLINSTVPMVRGAIMTTSANGTVTLRWAGGATFTFVPGDFLTGSVITEIRDPGGNITRMTRPPGVPSQITEITDPVGRKLVFAYDGANRITSITDPIGRVVRYTYTASGHLATFTNAIGGVTTYQYDAQNRLSRASDPRGVILAQNTYDANGRVVQQVTPSGGSYQYAYTLVNPLVPTSPVLQTALTDPRGNTSVYRFNPEGFLVSVTDPTGQARYFDREQGTNLLLAIRGEGSCQVCGATSAGDQFYTYDANGNRITETDALGKTVTYTYHPVFNRVTSIKSALGHTATMTYDSRGNLASLTDERGNATVFTYDSNGLVSEIQDPGGNKTRFTYDIHGNRIKITNPLNQELRFVYDAVSRLISRANSLGQLQTFAYNANEQLTQSTDGTGAITQITYDAAGFLKSFTDPRGGKVNFSYDSAGRLASRTDQVGLSNTYAYDAANNLVAEVNRRGQQFAYSYDSLNRLVVEIYPDARVDRTYDASGRLSRVVDASVTFSMMYDAAGRLIRYAGPFGAIDYTRDANGRVATRQVQGQPAVAYTYDATGNLTRAAMGTVSVDRTFNSRNLLQSLTRSNGTAATYTYDALGRLIGTSHNAGATNLVSRSLTYDDAGRIVGQSAETGQPLSTPSAAATFDAANRLVSTGGTTVTSDNDGNRSVESAAAGATSYTWDSRGRLQAIQAPGGVSTTFAYDFSGNLIFKRVIAPGQNSVEQYLVDELANVVAIGKTSGTTSLLTGDQVDSHWATLTGNVASFALADHLGSTVAVTDGAGVVTGRASYEAYGGTATTGMAFPFEFAGRQRVAPSLYYLRARYLDVANGRFLSEDPLDISGGDSDLYAYVGGDPMSYTDPYGLYSFDDFLQDASNFSGGFGDTITAPLDWVGNAVSGHGWGTKGVRQWMGTDQFVNPCSGWYTAGEWAGYAWWAAVIGPRINNNPILRFGRGWKSSPNGPAKQIWRFASGGRWGKGGPKLPWHWHWP